MKDKLQKSIKRKYTFHTSGSLTRNTLENTIESDGIVNSNSLVARYLKLRAPNDQNTLLEVLVFLCLKVCE